MADHSRIEDLRRRVHKDPASIAFAQLAEECRRAGQHQEAVDVCRAGLAIHPGYLSARVTLGRALIELNELDTALGELTVVLKGAPENLAAIRGVAEIHHRRGELAAALAQYRAALALARNDPDLQQTVSELARQIEPPPASADGLSFEQMQSEFLKMAPLPARPTPPPPSRPAPDEAASAPRGVDASPPATDRDAPSSMEIEPAVHAAPAAEAATASGEPVTLTESAAPVESPPALGAPALPAAEETAINEPAMQTIVALEQWLDAIHVARADRGA